MIHIVKVLLYDRHMVGCSRVSGAWGWVGGTGVQSCLNNVLHTSARQYLVVFVDLPTPGLHIAGGASARCAPSRGEYFCWSPAHSTNEESATQQMIA